MTQILNSFKQDSREYSQPLDLNYNSKRFMIVTLQTLAKFYFQVEMYEKSLSISVAADHLPKQLAEHDFLYMEVNNFNQRKQSQEIKAKQDQRANDIRDLITKV